MSPYWPGWSEEERLAHVECNLEGKALAWFRGANGRFFKTTEEFKKEFTENFDGNEDSAITKALKIIKVTKLKVGKVEEALLNLFALQADELCLKDIIEVVTLDASLMIRQRLSGKETWKDLLKEAQRIDKEKEFTNEKSATDTSRRYTKKKGIKCFTCGGEHYRSECNRGKKTMDKDSKPQMKTLSLQIENEKEDCPRIGIEVKGEKITALIDSGASENFVDQRVAERLKMKTEPLQEKVKLAQGECTARGEVKIKIQTKDKRYCIQTRAVVIKELEEDFIIGFPLIKTLKINLHGQENQEINILQGYKAKLLKNRPKLCIKAIKDKEMPGTETSKASEGNFGEDENLNERIKQMLEEMKIKIESEGQNRLILKHRIELEDENKVVYINHRRKSIQENELISEQVKELLKKE